MSDHWHHTLHQAAAKAEGWDIFEVGPDPHAPYEVQRYDEDAILPDDWTAHSRVLRGAEAGVSHCVAALTFIARHSPAEYDNMLERDAEGFYEDYSIDGPLNFEIAEEPAPGTVRVITPFRGVDELRHLAPDMASAEAWLASNRYSGARLDVVGAPASSPDALGEPA